MRSKEAIAILRGFCKQQSKTQDLDGVFAKGILAALRWMTEENSPVPYAELEEDMPEDGGWLGSSSSTTPVAPPISQLAPPSPRVAQFVPQPPVEGSSTPPSPMPEEPSRLVMPGSFELHAQEHPWLRELMQAGIQSEEHGTVQLSDGNAVVVGGGLGQGPILGGGGEGY